MKCLKYLTLLVLYSVVSSSIANLPDPEPFSDSGYVYDAPEPNSRSIFHSAPAHEYHPYRTISLDTDYFTSPYSNRAFSDFGVELFQLHAFTFDVLNDYTPCGHWLLRSLFFTTDLLFSVYLSDVYLVSYHELGHATRFRAFGWYPSFVGRPNNFFGFFFNKFGEPFSNEATLGIGSTPLTADQHIVVAAAGVNNEMRFAGDLADEAYFNHGHITHLWPYLAGKLSSATYPLAYSGRQ